ncbi:hypothetical protein DXG01_004807, partial [Tephrocybe rancida]
MREIKLLQWLQHLNVVWLYEMMVVTGSVYMVFEPMGWIICIMLSFGNDENDEIHQLDVVYKIFGTPPPERWAGIMDLP